METIPRRYTDLERQELIDQWKQSGKNKTEFCKENSLSYFSFCDWIRKRKRVPKTKSSFIPVKIKPNSEKPFAEISLKSGTVITLYKEVNVAFLSCLVK